MTYVNDIETSRHDPDTVYVALNNHKMGADPKILDTSLL